MASRTRLRPPALGLALDDAPTAPAPQAPTHKPATAGCVAPLLHVDCPELTQLSGVYWLQEGGVWQDGDKCLYKHRAGTWTFALTRQLAEQGLGVLKSLDSADLPPQEALQWEYAVGDGEWHRSLVRITTGEVNEDSALDREIAELAKQGCMFSRHGAYSCYSRRPIVLAPTARRTRTRSDTSCSTASRTTTRSATVCSTGSTGDDEAADSAELVVCGAGGIGVHTNGPYRVVGLCNDRPKYKQVHGDAIIYWHKVWKLNYRDDITGWYYVSASDTYRPCGAWTTQGFRNQGAEPAPLVVSGAQYALDRQAVEDEACAASAARLFKADAHQLPAQAPKEGQAVSFEVPLRRGHYWLRLIASRLDSHAVLTLDGDVVGSSAQPLVSLAPGRDQLLAPGCELVDACFCVQVQHSGVHRLVAVSDGFHEATMALGFTPFSQQAPALEELTRALSEPERQEFAPVLRQLKAAYGYAGAAWPKVQEQVRDDASTACASAPRSPQSGYSVASE